MRVNNDVTLGIGYFSLVSTFMNELLVPHKRASISMPASGPYNVHTACT